jgi:hypothetical protein
LSRGHESFFSKQLLRGKFPSQIVSSLAPSFPSEKEAAFLLFSFTYNVTVKIMAECGLPHSDEAFQQCGPCRLAPLPYERERERERVIWSSFLVLICTLVGTCKLVIVWHIVCNIARDNKSAQKLFVL